VEGEGVGDAADETGVVVVEGEQDPGAAPVLDEATAVEALVGEAAGSEGPRRESGSSRLTPPRSPAAHRSEESSDLRQEKRRTLGPPAVAGCGTSRWARPAPEAQGRQRLTRRQVGEAGVADRSDSV
jgi:hypothetical protein